MRRRAAPRPAHGRPARSGTARPRGAGSRTCGRRPRAASPRGRETRRRAASPARRRRSRRRRSPHPTAASTGTAARLSTTCWRKASSRSRMAVRPGVASIASTQAASRGSLATAPTSPSGTPGVRPSLIGRRPARPRAWLQPGTYVLVHAIGRITTRLCRFRAGIRPPARRPRSGSARCPRCASRRPSSSFRRRCTILRSTAVIGSSAASSPVSRTRSAVRSASAVSVASRRAR